MPNDTQPSTSGMSNKMRYIIGGIVILLLLGWLATRGGFCMRGIGDRVMT